MNYRPATARKKKASGSVGVIRLDRVKPAGEARRVSMRALAVTTKLVLKAARCHCSDVCQRWALLHAWLRLHELAIPTEDVIDMDCLKKLHLVPAMVTKVKIIKSGELDKAVKVSGLAVTKGARAAIEAAGGSVE